MRGTLVQPGQVAYLQVAVWKILDDGTVVVRVNDQELPVQLLQLYTKAVQLQDGQAPRQGQTTR